MTPFQSTKILHQIPIPKGMDFRIIGSWRMRIHLGFEIGGLNFHFPALSSSAHSESRPLSPPLSPISPFTFCPNLWAGIAIKASVFAAERIPANIQALRAAAEFTLPPSLFLGTRQAVGMNLAQETPVDTARHRKTLHGAKVKAHAMPGSNLLELVCLLFSAPKITGN